MTRHWNNKGRIIFGSLLLALFALCFLLYASSSKAKVTGVCSNCHTMHNSQGGNNMQIGYGSTTDAKPNLLRVNGCLGCHATTSSGATWQGVGGAPIVYNTTGVTYGDSHNDGYNVGLAAGNFYYLNAGGSTGTPPGTLPITSQRRGHSIAGIPHSDVTGFPVVWDTPSPCGNCHFDIAEGCKSCHLPKHHKGDSIPIVDSEDGYYRFLGPFGDSHQWGVRGYEDDDWQEDSSGHNEYSGEGKTSGYFSINLFCDGCHKAIVDVSPWNYTWSTACLWLTTGYPHSLDSLPTPGPPSNNWDGYGGTIPEIYNLFFPIARTNISDGAYPSDTIVYNTSNVLTCLTCHRAHASPYNKMLRWDNTKAWGDMAHEEGCKFCHTLDPH